MKTPIHRLAHSLILAVLTTIFADAETYTWTGTLSSDWSDPANWNPNTGVPGAADTAIVNAGSPAIGGDVSIARLEFGGGTLAGAGTLTVTSALVWSGGSSMAGGGTTVIGPGATATLSGAGDRGLDRRTLLNRGTIVQPGPCRLTFYNGARVENQAGASVDLQGDVTWEYAAGEPGSVLNAGTFRKSAGAGTSTIKGLTFDNEGVLVSASGSVALSNTTFNNTGEVRVDTGELVLAGEGSSSGQLITTNDTAVIFQSGSPHLLEEAQLLGTGWYRIRGATVAFDGTVAVAQLELNTGQVTGAGTLTVTNALVWSGGSSMAGGGTTVIGSGATATLSGAGDRSLDNRALINQGTIVQPGPCRLTFYNGARVENQAGGLVDWQGDVTWDYAAGERGSVLNAGTFRKSAGAGTSAINGLTFDNAGTLGAWQGTLSFTISPGLRSTTTLAFGLAGTTHPNDYGRMSCSQPLQLAGRLAVVFLSGFVPGESRQFDVISAPVQGVFQSYSAPPISPKVFINPVYRADGVSLVTTDATPTVWGLPGLDAEQQFHLSIHGIANLSYVVMSSVDFEDWTPLATNAVPASTVWEFIDGDSPVSPFRFYRVFYQP